LLAGAVLRRGRAAKGTAVAGRTKPVRGFLRSGGVETGTR